MFGRTVVKVVAKFCGASGDGDYLEMGGWVIEEVGYWILKRGGL